VPLVSSPRVDQPSVLVIGAGLIDSSAKQLVKKGCVVPLLEASARPEAVDQAGCVMHSVSAKYNLRASPAAGASGKSWPWLNANHKQPAHYQGTHQGKVHQYLQRASLHLYVMDLSSYQTPAGCSYRSEA